jgi:hypothetical protein
MGQACTPTVIYIPGCPHCENLMNNLLPSAKIAFTSTQSGSCACYPCATLCDGSSVSSCGGSMEQAVFAAIQRSVASGTPVATPAQPVTTTTTPATSSNVVDNNPPWKEQRWSNTVTINWGGKNAPPVVAETPVGWMPPDIELTPVLPLPPAMQTGVTIALREHRRMPKGRKVA